MKEIKEKIISEATNEIWVGGEELTRKDIHDILDEAFDLYATELLKRVLPKVTKKVYKSNEILPNEKQQWKNEGFDLCLSTIKSNAKNEGIEIE